MSLRITKLLVALVVFSLLQEVSAQTQADQRDCLEAAKLNLEAQALQDYLRPYALGIRTFTGPSFPIKNPPKPNADDPPNPKSLQEAMREYLVNCRDGGSPICDAYSSARNAVYGGNPPDKDPLSPMHTDPISCEIMEEKYKMVYAVTETDDGPAEGFERVKWLFNYRHEEAHQANCKRENAGNSDTDNSPFLSKMKDPSNLAIEEYEAYDVSISEIENFQNKSCNVASMESAGAGDSTEMVFDSFPSRDILTVSGELQVKAGIAQPCMLRLNLKNTKTHESFGLQMDSDGPIKPGKFMATDAVAPEKAVGNFISGFSFGWGTERVNYRAESGTLELTSFSPELLAGKVEVYGRLPKRTYGESESSWPQTMSVRTEFMLVPRVNMGTDISSENCFAQ